MGGRIIFLGPFLVSTVLTVVISFSLLFLLFGTGQAGAGGVTTGRRRTVRGEDCI